VFEAADGILIPGGFGERGTEGKILAAEFARTRKVPFFGICLGMQLAVIEFARNVCGLSGANSTEFDQSTAYPVIDFLPGQKGLTRKGGTMRLGAYACRLEPGTLAMRAYGTDVISERHRHRYEVNPAFEESLVDKGIVVSGRNPQSALVEIVEVPGHPWFLGCQFHPEFKSKPMSPHPLFKDFIRASLEYRRNR
ncbi:MAG TPA: gamma-glutamyl-gamma-aminobutyrate hydrolase family protein, partial [Deltaproteobacteria bacterium]|nr:gamma-glutamyl-gamma-aminobutyrate hydrolase family protein [Deltaproteobacteria bacterium]